MHRIALLALVLAACHHHVDHVNGGILGRVVVYRNGVAFYERHATVEDGKLTVHVPRDRVDDFLKSLTVVDPTTRRPLAVTIPREQESGNTLTMTLETADRGHADVLLTYVTEAPAWKPSYRVVVGDGGKVMLEGWAIVDNTTSEDWNGVLVGVGASSALAFRYDLWSVHKVDRDLLAGDEKLAIAPPQAVSPYDAGGGGEVIASLSDGVGDGVGVAFSGSSSLENQYLVDGATTSGTVDASANAIKGVVKDKATGEQLAGVTVIATSPALNGSQTAITDEHGAYTIAGLPAGKYTVTFYYADVTVERSGVEVSAQRVAQVFQSLAGSSAGSEVIKIESRAPTIDPTSTQQGVTISKTAKNQPDNITGVVSSTTGKAVDNFGGFQHVTENHYAEEPRSEPAPAPKTDVYKDVVAKVGKDRKDLVIELHGPAGSEERLAARARTVTEKLVDDGIAATKIHVVKKFAPGEREGVRVLEVAPGAVPPPSGPPGAIVHGGTTDNPVGESHFMADRPMTVRSGTSAMVAMVHGETTGGVVYLFDPISERGDTHFAFKAVRLDNPTGDTLEPGPVTVYGDGRFIGEGITEPVPPHASVVVPFALDKEIVVDRKGADEDRIAKLVTAQRGVVTAELQHRRTTTFTLTSRLDRPARVYLRHRLEAGWTMLDAPAHAMSVGDSQLFAIELDAHQTRTVAISEATPVERTFDLATDQALGMMQLYIEEPDAPAELKTQITALLVTHHTAADLADKILTLRDQLVEYRQRSGELHGQLVSLKLVRTSGDLMEALRGKLRETSERIQKATIAVVDTQEQLMMLRVKFANQLADLHLGDATKSITRR